MQNYECKHPDYPSWTEEETNWKLTRNETIWLEIICVWIVAGTIIYLGLRGII